MRKGRENGVLTWKWRNITAEQCEEVRREQRRTRMMESERMMVTWREDKYGQD